MLKKLLFIIALLLSTVAMSQSFTKNYNRTIMADGVGNKIIAQERTEVIFNRGYENDVEIRFQSGNTFKYKQVSEVTTGYLRSGASYQSIIIERANSLDKVRTELLLLENGELVIDIDDGILIFTD